MNKIFHIFADGTMIDRTLKSGQSYAGWWFVQYTYIEAYGPVIAKWTVKSK